MTASSTYSRNGSSASTPAEFSPFVSWVESAVNALPQAIVQAITAVEKEEKTFLEDRLNRHPDWAAIKPNANVRYGQEGMVYQVPGAQAHQLEYGNPEESIVATGLVRSTAKRREYDVQQSLTGHINKAITSA
jgi:hypothetical protein